MASIFAALGTLIANLPQILVCVRLFLELVSRVEKEQRAALLAQAATGLRKIKEAKTDDEIFDALGDLQSAWRVRNDKK